MLKQKCKLKNKLEIIHKKQCREVKGSGGTEQKLHQELNAPPTNRPLLLIYQKRSFSRRFFLLSFFFF